MFPARASPATVVLLAVVRWLFFYPSLETAQTFAVAWIFQTWAINMIMMLAVAGGLHWYF